MRLEEILREGFDKLALPSGEDILKRYRVYYDFLSEKNEVMNLTAISGEEDSANLHFIDSAALLNFEDFKDKKVIDIGTGAGFPGMCLKISEPSVDLTLLDSLDKRVNFLSGLCEKLEIGDVKCTHARAEEISDDLRESFDIAVSRAVGRLNILCEMCLPYVKPGGCFIAMKGPDPEQEISEAINAVKLLGGELEKTVKYEAGNSGAVHSAVIVRKRSQTPKKYPRRWAQIKKSPL